MILNLVHRILIYLLLACSGSHINFFHYVISFQPASCQWQLLFFSFYTVPGIISLATNERKHSPKMSELNCSWNFIQSHNDKMCSEDEYGTLTTSLHNLRKQNHLSQTRESYRSRRGISCTSSPAMKSKHFLQVAFHPGQRHPQTAQCMS